MSKIELLHIDKYYGTNHVLKDISLTIEDGDFMTLLGPSGCGKTTTLRVISGLEKPQGGKMLMDGNTVIDSDEAFYLEPAKRGLNLVFQSYALWPHMTVFENVAFGLRIKKFKKEQIKSMVMSSLEKMKIGEFYDRYPSELSGGQQQRVAMARAIAGESKLLLLDEPLSNLDAKLRIDMRAELKRLHNELGTTIVYVTHDQIEAMTMSTKIALFENGTLSQVAPPLDLYMNPATLKAADFIGNPRINFISGKASFGNGSLLATCGIGSFRFEQKDMTADVPSGDFDCVFGLRPELIAILTEPEDGAIEARVYADQPAGSETLVSLVVGKDELLAKQIGIRQYAINQTVYLKIDPGKLNIYGKASEKLVKRAV
jgi:multiple sugar transport system ATP-binding protein